MKKVQRSFTVEYKSGRKKIEGKPHSIWGNMDLKSVARAVEEDGMAPPLAGSDHRIAEGEVNTPEVKQGGPALAGSLEKQKPASDAQEMIMADSDTMTETENSTVAETIDAPKAQRKPRVKKALAEGAPANVTTEPAAASSAVAVKQRKPRKVKTSADSVAAKPARVKRAPKIIDEPAKAPTVAVDEMADLLQLEEENHKLRKLLAEKLRAENADLRKRLHLD